MRPVLSHAELLQLSDDDPWVRWGLPSTLPAPAWFDGRVVLVPRLGARPGFWVTPLSGPATADAIRSALTWLRDSGHLDSFGAAAVSVPQEHLAVAQGTLDLGQGGDWEWMWTMTAPPLDPRESLLVELDDSADAEEIADFSRAHNSRVWTEVGVGRVHGWLGLRDADGRLIAVGGTEVEDSGVPHLAGIVTARDRRSQGLGSVISAALTRVVLDEHGVCTLGMFSDNEVARRLYHRLGYRTARRWSSRRLAPEHSGSRHRTAQDLSKTSRPPT